LLHRISGGSCGVKGGRENHAVASSPVPQIAAAVVAPPKLSVREPLTQLTRQRFCLHQPVRHAHFGVHRCCEGEVLLSLSAIAFAAMQLGEAEVAVGDERTHAAELGERQRLAVQTFITLGARCGGDVTVEAEGMGLVSPGAQPSGKRQSFLGVADGWSICPTKRLVVPAHRRLNAGRKLIG
jgi:hypothetical protein